MASEGLEIGMVLLPGCRCRCGHEWFPRNRQERPRVCPKCKSYNWDFPRLEGNPSATKEPPRTEKPMPEWNRPAPSSHDESRGEVEAA